MKQYRFRVPRDHRWGKADGRHALSFLVNLEEIQKEFQVTLAKGSKIQLGDGFKHCLQVVARCARQKRKLIFIGNGGSAAIASHQAVDYWKNGGLEAIAFNDSSLITCIGNDCGFQNLFQVPLQRFARRGDVLFAISSSGASANILCGVRAARALGCQVITFSGFSPTNPLRSLGAVNFYVPSNAYGIVEVSHLALIHSMLREIIYLNPKAMKRGY